MLRRRGVVSVLHFGATRGETTVIEAHAWVDAAGNYVRLHVKGESFLFRETMSAMETRLDPSRFVHIHRSHIVNTDRINELQPGTGEHSVVLLSGVRLPLSRGYRDTLQARLGKSF